MVLVDIDICSRNRGVLQSLSRLQYNTFSLIDRKFQFLN